MYVYALEVDELPSSAPIAELAFRYEEGELVRYGDGEMEIGVVTDIFEQAIEWPDREEDVAGSSDSPTYVVALAEGGGVKPFKASELQELGRDTLLSDPDVDPVETLVEESDELALGARYDGVEELLSIPAVDDPGVGWDSYPDSWEESPKPNRLILLDAWTSMGASWRGAFQELKSKRLASSMKDEVYMTDMWRSWSD